MIFFFDSKLTLFLFLSFFSCFFTCVFSTTLYSNLMQHLGIIEQRTNEVLQMYAASGAAFQDAGGNNEDDEGNAAPGEHSSSSTMPTDKQRRRLSLGVGPQQASGSHVVHVDPPAMEESDTNSGGSFMIDESDRPMTRIELLRMIKEQPPSMESNTSSNAKESTGTKSSPSGGRRRRK